MLEIHLCFAVLEMALFANLPLSLAGERLGLQ
jgi:hypothetical protein